MHRLSRRELLAASASVALLSGKPPVNALAADLKPPKEAERLTAYQVGPQIWLRWNNRLLTSYRAHPTQKYPYFFPMTGLGSGLSLTTETGLPYPHHRSLLFACDHVNDGNYWQADVKEGQIISTDLKLGKCTPESAEILDHCEWRKPDQPVVMSDQRRFIITVVSPRLWTLDAEITWTAVEDVTVRKTNHALFSVRAAADLCPAYGGTLVSSEGQTGAQATFGKPARWCAYFGKRDGVGQQPVEGIALLDHPKNPWSPCPWFTRDYGFISPSPFNFIEEPWLLPKGQSVALRYRVLMFVGDPQEAEVEKLYREWAT